MNTPSPFTPSSSSTSTASSASQPVRGSVLSFLAIGVLGGLFLFAAVPRLARSWPRMVDRADQLCRRAQGPFVPLPSEVPARQLAGLNAH